MKKAQYILTILTVALCVFVCGFLIGRNMNKSTLSITQSTVNNVIPSDASLSNSPTTSHEKLRINLNSASADELMLLPRIGPTLANRIIEYRTDVGPFKDVADLCDINGIGEETLFSIIDYICV